MNANEIKVNELNAEFEGKDKELKKGLLLDSMGNPWALIKTNQKAITVCETVSTDGLQFINQRLRKVTHSKKRIAKFEAQDQDGLRAKKVYGWASQEIFVVR